MKTFSIVIPHFNNINGIKRLLNSIYLTNNTTLFKEFINNLKVIIVDDYSNTDNLNELKELSVLYGFTLFNNKEIKSAGTCRNIGLTYTKSDYVIFLDSDDFFTNDYWKLLIEISNLDFDIAYFPPKSVYNDNIDVEAKRHIRYKKIIEDYFINKNDRILRYCWPVPWSKVFKTYFLKSNNIKFDNTIVSNDIMFSTKSGHLAKKLIVLNKPFYISTFRNDSLERKFNINNIKIRMKIGLEYKKYCESIKFYDYSDHVFQYLFYVSTKQTKYILYLLKYAKKIGAFRDKRYFIKCFNDFILSGFKSVLKKTLNKFLNFKEN